MAPSPEQPALATTKRKFNQLLDNLSATASGSTASLASTLHSEPATPDAPPKRSRLSDVGSATMERPRVASGSERIRALQEQLFTPRRQATVGGGMRVVGSNKTPVKSTPPRKPPNFQPYSQEQFLARLKTFADVKKWTHKPDAVNEVEWAKRGWSCDMWNTVACKGGCEQRVAVKLRPKRKDKDDNDIEMTEDLDVEIDEGLVDKYQSLIVEGHHEDCLWRRGHCQDDIYHIPIANRAKSSAELLNRYHSLQTIAHDLPLLENITYPDPPIEDILKRIPSTLFNPPGSSVTEASPTSPTDIVAFTLALFGWAGVSESKISLAVCNHCFQRIGLWLSKDERIKEMSKKLDIPIESLRLNLLESHREHCPWKNAQVQGNSEDSAISNMPAWETLEFMLVGRRKPTEHRKNVDSVDLGEADYPRGSLDSDPKASGETDDSLHEKWRKFKAKLKRSTSKKSLKSSKSVRSVKSAMSSKSSKSVADNKSVTEKDKETVSVKD